MNVKNLEKKEKNTLELTVVVASDEFEKAVNTAYVKNRSKINVPGFRKGKAPRKVIEGMYGASVFYEDALDELFQPGFNFAVESEKLNVVGRPSVTDVKINDDKTVDIKYTVAVYPEVTMGQYKGIEAPKPAVRVLKAEVEEELEKVRGRSARIQAVERAAENGDTVNIDFEGFLDGVPFDGGKDTGYDLVLGSGYFVPGFEEQLVGTKAGDEKDLDIVFPENYAEDLAGKAVVFKVKVNEVKESILPELDDEFAKDVSEFDTLEEYKASLKEEISARKKASVEASFRNQVMAKVIEGMQCDVPNAMVEERVDSTIENYNYRLSQQGMTFESYMKALGMDLDAFRENAKGSALAELQEEIALDKIAELENLEATEEELEAEYDKYAQEYGMEKDNIKAVIPAEEVAKLVKREKAAELVYSSAVAEKKKAKKEEAKEAEEKAEE